MEDGVDGGGGERKIKRKHLYKGGEKQIELSRRKTEKKND